MKALFTITSILAIVLGLVGCKASPAARAESATAGIRQMNQEILSAQKKVIAKFKAMPEADAIRLDMGKNFDGWAVSDKNLSATEDDQEKALIGFQQESKEEALIGELHLYTKKVAKNCQENIPEYETRIVKTKKEVDEGKIAIGTTFVPLSDKDKISRINLIKVFTLQVEFLKEEQRIAESYEPKLAKLLG